MTTRLLGAALAAARRCCPATAHAAALTPLKPCYISVTQRDARRAAGDHARGARPRRQRLHARRARRPQLRRQARPHAPGRRAPATCRPQIARSPYRARGEGPFTLTAAEQGNPLNAVSLASAHDRARAAPAPARGRARQRRDPLHRPRLHRAAARSGRTTCTAARSARPCGWCGGSTTRAGAFSVRRSRSRSSARGPELDAAGRPAAALQPAPDSVFVRVKIEVSSRRRADRLGDARRSARRRRRPRAPGRRLENWPCSSPRASGSTRWRWITRLSGRAP